MKKRERGRAEREAQQIAHAHTQHGEGRWLGQVSQDESPLARAVIAKYNASADRRKACLHLQADFDQARFWVEALPEYLACKECTMQLAVEERKQADTCCVMCGDHTALRGVSLAVSGVLMRAGVCEKCEESAEVSLN